MGKGLASDSIRQGDEQAEAGIEYRAGRTCGASENRKALHWQVYDQTRGGKLRRPSDFDQLAGKAILPLFTPTVMAWVERAGSDETSRAGFSTGKWFCSAARYISLLTGYTSSRDRHPSCFSCWEAMTC